jgi:hypothetical protein
VRVTCVRKCSDRLLVISGGSALQALAMTQLHVPYSQVASIDCACDMQSGQRCFAAESRLVPMLAVWPREQPARK